MTRVARGIDLSEWLTRTEERLTTVEKRVQTAPRPDLGTGTVVYGPNLLPNPQYNLGASGWQNPGSGLLVSGAEAIEGATSFKKSHTATVPNVVREKHTFAVSPYAWRSYKGDSTYKVQPEPQHAWEGFFDTNDGNTKSFLWFDPAGFSDAIGSTPADWEVLNVLIYWEHWFWSEGGTAIIGAHTYNTVPAIGAVSPGNGFPDLIRYTWPGRYMSQSVNLIAVAGIADRIRDGTLRGIMLGPGPTTNNTYYGYARPYDIQLRGTYWKTLNISQAGLSSEVRSFGLGQSGQNVAWNASVLSRCTVNGTYRFGVWTQAAGGGITDTDLATGALAPNAIQRISGVTAVLPDTVLDMGVYFKVTGAPPSDGAGSTIPWSYTVDDWYLRQKVAG
jgi:hypothetical protein